MATTIDFPSQLPTPQRANYGLRPVATFARTTMASGRAKQRQIFTSVPSLVPVTWLFTEPQAQIFEAWFKYEISDGVDWFNSKLKSPIGLKDYECRFAEMYRGPELVGLNHWRYTARLEIVERPTITENWYLYGLDYVNNSSIFDVAMNQKWPAA